MAAQSSGVSTTPPSLVSSADLLRVHSNSSSRSLMKKLNKTGPSTDPWGTPLVTGLQLDTALLKAGGRARADNGGYAGTLHDRVGVCSGDVAKMGSKFQVLPAV